MLGFIGSQRVRHDSTTELTELKDVFLIEVHVEENEEFYYPERCKFQRRRACLKV